MNHCIKGENIMSDMNVPQDPRSVDKSIPLTDRKLPPQDTTPVAPSKDTIEAFSANELPSAKRASDAPELETPQLPKDSLLYYFKTIRAASLALRRQLSASDLVDQESRRVLTLAAVFQSEYVSKLYQQLQEALERIKGEAKQALEDVQKKLEEMQKETKEQQNRIDQINSGNAQEKQKSQDLSLAYDNYIKNLKSIGAVDLGNGQYSIPEGKETEFNVFTQVYQNVVDDYNVYWKGRQTEINKYNSATIAYNQSVVDNNKYVNDLINKYDLSDYLNKKGVGVPNQSGAGLRDLSGYENQIIAPAPIDKTPANISSFPPPNYIRSIGNSGPPPLSNLESYKPIDGQILYDGIYANLYEMNVAPVNQKILSNHLFWAFLRTLFTTVQETTPDPMLNSKLLALKILPTSFIESSMPIKPSSTGAGGIAMQAMGLSSAQLEDILGRSLLEKMLEASNLKLFEGKDEAFKKEKINQMADQLLLLSVGLLGNQSLQALFPSLGPISQFLETLPKDSPAFAILFAISFANRIQEDAKLGITAEAVQNFLNANPELAALSEEDKTKLGAIINLGQLLVAGKMVETNLGLQGLLAQLVSTLLPSIDPNTLLSKSGQEGRESLIELQTHLESNFLDQGYQKETAQFLAKVGTELAEQGVLTPSATSVNSPQQFNQPLLMDSVKAALVIANYPLKEADTIAQEAIHRTMAEGPYTSPKQFRTALESHLQDLGVRDEKSSTIAKQAILIPPEEKSLSLLVPTPLGAPITSPPTEAPLPAATPEPSRPTSVQTPTPSTPEAPLPSAPTPTEPSRPSTTQTQAPSPTPVARTGVSSKPLLSQAELMAILEKRSLELLVPQLGMQLAKQVTEEIAKTLFGNPHPDAADVADVKSPFSLVNVIRDQLYHLQTEQNQEWAEAVSQTFKESIKTMIEFYPFSLKIQDPAYLFIYSSDTGIIYGGDQGKKKLDIQI
jgi:hypothetical protein